jgi:PAS domain S-box-containing protein
MREEKTSTGHLIKKLKNSRKTSNKLRKSASHVNYTDEDLRESEQIFRAIFENVAVGILLADTGTKKFLMGNKQIYESLGYGPEEIKTLELRDIHPEKDLPHIRDQFEKLIRNEIVVSKDIPVKRKDGSIYYADISALPIHLINRTLTIGIFRDVSDRMRAVESLKESEEKFRRIVDTANEGIWMLDADLQTTFVNSRSAEMIGYQVEEIIGRRFDSFLFEEDLPDHEKRIEARKQGTAGRYERRLRHKDGHAVWTLISTSPILDSEHHFQGSFAMITDITERKRMDEALRDSEERFRGLAESMTQLAWIADEKGNSVYHNPQFAEYTGMKVSTFEERLQVVHPEDRPLVEQAWQQVVSSKDVFECSYRIRRRDGEYRWFLVRVFLLHDAGNHLVRWFGTATDINDFKEAERALKENMMILAEAERIGHTGSWKRDLATNQTIWSDETRRIFGLSEDEEVLFETLKSRIHPEDRDDLLQKIRETEEKGTPLEAEYRIILPDRTIRHIYVKGEATYSIEGKPLIIHGFVLDITERKRLEDELMKVQKLDSIGILAGGIAHDYNNLLTVIMGNIDLAKMHISANEKAHALLERAEQAARNARDLTQQFITFSRGGKPISKVMNIRNLIYDAVKLSMRGSNMRPEWNIANDLPEAKIDENQIRLAIQNIVINAREAMLDGGTLHIDADKMLLEADNDLSLPGGTYIRLSFRDEGTGISPENLPKVFDPYFTTKAKGATRGLGLGLTICYSVIKRHMGHISVDSEEGNGTTVTIHIPAAMVHIEM